MAYLYRVRVGGIVFGMAKIAVVPRNYHYTLVAVVVQEEITYFVFHYFPP